MFRWGFAIGFLALGVAAGQGPWPTASAPKPLPPEDQAQIDQLRQRIASSKRLSEQQGPQRELLDLLSRLRGKEHWETIDARLQLEHLERALQLSQRPVEEWRKHVTHRMELMKLQDQARQMAKRGQAAEARPIWQRYVAGLQSNPMAKPGEIASGLDDAAYAALACDDLIGAEKLFQDCLELRLKVYGPAHPETARGYRRLAQPLFKQGRNTEARTKLEHALAIHSATLGREHSESCIYLNNYAQILAEEGDLAAAELAVVEGIALARTLKSPDMLASLTETQGLVLLGMGRLAEAEATYREVLVQFARVQVAPEVIALAWNNLGYCLKERSQREADPLLAPTQLREAEQAYRRALAALERTGRRDSHDAVLIEQNLACLALVQGRFKEGAERHRQLLDKLREQGSPAAVASIASNLALCEYELGHYPVAEKTLRELLAALEPRLGEHHEIVVTLRHNLATTLASQGHFDAAEAVFRVCADDYEMMRGRRASTGLERSEGLRFAPYQALAGLAARRGDAVAAFEMLERGLGRGCLEDGTRLLSTEERSKLRLLEKQLAELEGRIAKNASGPDPELDRLKTEHGKALLQLKRMRLALQAKHGPAAGLGQVLPWKQIQAALTADAAFVAWIDEPGCHWACVLRASGDPVWIDLAKDDPRHEWTEEQAELPRLLAEAIRDREKTNTATLQDDLSEQRVRPLLPHLEALGSLPRARHVIVMASGDLHAIPVALLFPDHTVSATPSGSLFALARQRGPVASPPRVLTLADPLFEADRLLHSRGEALAIAQQVESQFGSKAATLLLGAEANAKQLQALCASDHPAPFRYLHLCTHGRAGSARAWDAALQFPHEKSGDGRRTARVELTASQVLRTWNLDAELVVLSACNSGLGKRVAGEGFVGFTQALLLAGSRSVMVSHWPVSDRATTLLMGRFYENLLGPKKLGKAAALAEAQQWLRGLSGKAARQMLIARAQAAGLKLEEGRLPADSDECIYAHPWYWAGFTLVGTP